MMIYLSKQLAYRQMSLFITSSSRTWSFIRWCLFIYIVVLLERAAKMSRRFRRRFFKQHYLLFETQSGDVSAYIPTNVISITDWSNLFRKWLVLCAVFVLQLTVGISVSRVGSAAQVKDFTKISRYIRN